jgi:pyridoxine 5-phosphate synthase
MTKLSVNINKIALLRNSRGHDLPNVNQVALDCVKFGADGITVHPRPDERHTTRADVYSLKEILDVEFNVEGYPSEDFLRMVEEVKPAQVTLVPDAPNVLTSNAGWNTIQHRFFLVEVITRLQKAGLRTSLFVAPDLEMIEGARAIGTDRIELYTEDYANAHKVNDADTMETYFRAAAFAHELGLGINAGHDLNLDNLAFFAQNIPNLAEVSIGHALISDALYLGLEETIKRYQKCLGK